MSHQKQIVQGRTASALLEILDPWLRAEQQRLFNEWLQADGDNAVELRAKAKVLEGIRAELERVIYTGMIAERLEEGNGDQA